MGYGFQIDVLSRIIDHGYGVSEIPITFRNRSSGGSKLGLSQAWVFIQEVSRLNRISRLSNQTTVSQA